MSQGKYLNVILTVNAALLSALVWTQLSGGSAPSLETAAHAQPQMRPQAPTPAQDGTGIPNAAAQRQRVIEELQSLRASVDGMRKTIDGGKMRVVVANADELRAAAAPKER